MKHKLGFNLNFVDLYTTKALKKLDATFLAYLKAKDLSTYNFLLQERSLFKEFTENYSNDARLLKAAKILESFLVELFSIKTPYIQVQKKYKQQQNLFYFRQVFVNKYIKTFNKENLLKYHFPDIEKQLFKLLRISALDELQIIQSILTAVKKPKINTELLNLATIFGAFLMFDETAKAKYPKQLLFFKAKKTNFQQLIPFEKNHHAIKKHTLDSNIIRNDFSLYNHTTLQEAQHQSNYCVKCHLRNKDYCSHGEKINNNYKTNPLKQPLEGCPLAMHISEMHSLYNEGNLLAALGVATINNPLLAGTGENICHDCKTSCIFQKQETVDTPKVESYILHEILSLPWGFEIYSLLTRWNPLRHYRPFPKPPTKYKVLVVGLGPAGYTLAYNLAMEGHGVVAIDALKLEPLYNFNTLTPIIHCHRIWEELDERCTAGFGGVAEYGITSRWDKNYLTVLRIILERQANILLQGSTYFGGLINFQNAKELGFHHIALCTGAGQPNMLHMKNSMVSGIKTSSEFLMNLHLGAFQLHNLLNLQIQLPLVVIGAGLTAVDCATEAYVYYQRLLQKVALEYKRIQHHQKEEAFLQTLTNQEKKLLTTYLQHHKLLEQVKDSPEKIIPTLQQLGGVQIIYHKPFNESNAYKQNYQELQKALQQGVEFIENTIMQQINLNKYQEVTSIKVKNNLTKEITQIPVKTIIFALGTHPNRVALEKYLPPNIHNINNNYTQQDDNYLHTTKTENSNNALELHNYMQTYKGKTFSVYQQKINSTDVTIFGDSHNIFNGSVVKAMASSHYGQYTINKLLAKIQPSSYNFAKFKGSIQKKLLLKVTNIKELQPKLMEITVENPLLVNNFQAGQFFKLQTYATNNTKLTKKIENIAEPIFLTGVQTSNSNPKQQIKLFLQPVGASSQLVLNHRNIVISGPLGQPTPQHQNKNILLIGGGVANAVTFSILETLHKENNIYYIGGYRNQTDIFYEKQIKKHALTTIFTLENNNSKNYVTGNVINGLEYFMQHNPKLHIHELLVAGSCSMMEAVQQFTKNHKYFTKTKSTASLNSMMQCGLKGICGTCIQQVGNQLVYSCKQQEQELTNTSFSFLANKLRQNSLQEKLSFFLKNN
ncbi:Dihydroorotate dehydrogenase B (NAD(+)), electron transfer subunit [Candidatus Hepatincola sp. Pdp]